MQENIHMNYTYIDMENYPRRAHFSYFTEWHILMQESR